MTIQHGDRVFVSSVGEGFSPIALVEEVRGEYVYATPSDTHLLECFHVSRCHILPGGQMLEKHAHSFLGPVLLWSPFTLQPIKALSIGE